MSNPSQEPAPSLEEALDEKVDQLSAIIDRLREDGMTEREIADWIEDKGP